MKARGVLYIVLSAVIFGFMPVLTELSYSYGNNPYNMALFRNLMVLPVLWMMIRRGRLSMKLIKYEKTGVLLVSVLGSALTTILLYSSYTYIGVGTATTIHFLYPLLVCVYCRLFFGEKLTLHRSVCLVLCMAGVLCFLDTGSVSNIKGVLMAAGSAVTYSFYMTYLGKMGLTRIHPAVFSFYLSSIVSIFMLLLNLPLHFIVPSLPWQAYGLMFGVSIGTSLAASILLNKGIAIIGASTASIFSLFEPITGVIMGVVMLGEAFGVRNGIGCGMIFGGILWMAGKEKGCRSITKSE